MDWGQLILQLGISGAVLFVGYKIGLKVIATWSKAESERNTAWATAQSERNIAWATAESERNEAIRDGFRADIAAHQAITTFVQKLAQQFSRLEGKLDTILDLTPVRDQQAMSELVPDVQLPEARVIVDPDLRREKVGRKTPPQGVPGIYGPQKAGGK